MTYTSVFDEPEQESTARGLTEAEKEVRRAEYHEACAKAFSAGQPTPDLPLELREARIQVNDPRDNPQNFKIGDLYWRSSWRDGHRDRQAIPHAWWARPGEVATQEEIDEYDKASILWLQAQQALFQCIRRWGYKLFEPKYWNDPSQSQSCRIDQMFAEDWSFLCGLWQGRGMKVPTEEKLTDWAKEEWDRTHGGNTNAQHAV